MGGMAGRALAKLALTKKYKVGGTIYKNFPEELKNYSDLNLLNYYKLDLKKAGEVKSALLDFQPDAVVHFAGKAIGRSDVRIFNPNSYAENIIIFQNLIRALKVLRKRPRFILTSGCLVYNASPSSGFRDEVPAKQLPEIDSEKEPYRAGRFEQEKLLAREDLDYIITRPTQFTGPGKFPGTIEWYIAAQVAKILEGHTNTILLNNKLGEVDMLDVRDVARAYIILIEKGKEGNVYHISSGSPVTAEKLAKVFLETVGLNPTKISVKSTGKEETIYFRFSPDKLNQLGWYPKFSLSDSLLGYWNFFKNQSNI